MKTIYVTTEEIKVIFITSKCSLSNTLLIDISLSEIIGVLYMPFENKARYSNFEFIRLNLSKRHELLG